MSVAQEIERISQAKQNLSDSFQKRGISIEDKRLNDYAGLLDNAPGVARGVFVPDRDVNLFEINFLPFKPQSFMITSKELFSAPLINSIVSIAQQKEMSGIISYTDDLGLRILASPIDDATPAATWGNNCFSLEVPFSVGITFKANYAYTWIITGGFEE